MQKINTSKTTKDIFNPNVAYRGIGINIAKNFLSVCAIDDNGVISYRAKMPHDELIRQLASLKSVRIVMEPCAGAAKLAERIRTTGHTPILVSGTTVKAAVQAHCNGQKNDRNDALVMARHGTKEKTYTLKSAVACGCKLARIALSLLKDNSSFEWRRAAVSNR